VLLDKYTAVFPSSEAYKGKIRSELCNLLKISMGKAGVKYIFPARFAVRGSENNSRPDSLSPPSAKSRQHNNLLQQHLTKCITWSRSGH
jgi:hypothetical protein